MPQLKPIESFGLNRPALESISSDMLDVTLEAYNEQYGTEYTKENKPEAIDYFISGLILISLFGWDKADKSKLPKETLDQLENIFKDPKTEKVEYEGINATTQKDFDNALFKQELVKTIESKGVKGDISKDKAQKAIQDIENSKTPSSLSKEEFEEIREETAKNIVKNKPKLSEENQKKVTKKRTKVISESLSTTLYHNINEILATNDGLEYVGGITMGDDLVRPKHQEHNRKYWKKDEYKPWYDFNCRCFYNFGSKEKLESLGYTRLKGI
jgi:hypothetical protein